jgi:hypothetical protein
VCYQVNNVAWMLVDPSLQLCHTIRQVRAVNGGGLFASDLLVLGNFRKDLTAQPGFWRVSEKAIPAARAMIRREGEPLYLRIL